MEPTSLEMRLQYESQAEDVEHVELVDDLLVRFHREPEQPLRMPACPHLPMHTHNRALGHTKVGADGASWGGDCFI
jgi:hypothetical protein